MNDTTISLRGYVASDVTLRDAGDHQVANFRVGVTPRLLNRTSGEWYDGPTQWYSVVAWRQLGQNVKRSIFKGEPIVVRGRLTVQEWADKDGVLRTTLEVEADSVGHDLARGTSLFVRPARPAAAPEGGTTAEASPAQGDPWAVPGVTPQTAPAESAQSGSEAAEVTGPPAATPDGQPDGGTGGEPGDEPEGDPLADWRAA